MPREDSAAPVRYVSGYLSLNRATSVIAVQEVARRAGCGGACQQGYRDVPERERVQMKARWNILRLWSFTTTPLRAMVVIAVIAVTVLNGGCSRGVAGPRIRGESFVTSGPR